MLSVPVALRAGISSTLYLTPGYYKRELAEFDQYEAYRRGAGPAPTWLSELIPGRATTAAVTADGAGAVYAHPSYTYGEESGPMVSAQPPGATVSVPAPLAALLSSEAQAQLSAALLPTLRRAKTFSAVAAIVADFTFVKGRWRDAVGRRKSATASVPAAVAPVVVSPEAATTIVTDSPAPAPAPHGPVRPPAPAGGPSDSAMASDSSFTTAAIAGELSASASRLRSLEALNYRTARRLLQLSAAQGGAYIKAAQHLANLGHGTPAVYKDLLGLMQDRAPAVTLDQVEATVRGEFGGRAISELFSRFDPVPVAAASLAQVHHAVTYDGHEVAVKVQYPYLRGVTDADVRTMLDAVRLVEWRFPSFQGVWIVGEFERNIRRELDFVAEAASTERIAALFGARDDLYVPGVRWDLTTPRVLVTEFIHGCRISDADALRAAGLSPQGVMDTFVRAFGQMIFSFGFVHCDPHPGNALVRVSPAFQTAEERARRAQVAAAVGALPPLYKLGGGETYDHVRLAADYYANGSAESSNSGGAASVTSVNDLPPALFRAVSQCSPPPPRLRALIAIALALQRNPHAPEPFERVAAQLSWNAQHAGGNRGTTHASMAAASESRFSTAFARLSSPWESFVRWLWGGGWSRPRHQIVLLDHGLYRELDPMFRRGMSTLFSALYRRDTDGVRAGAAMMGAEKYWRLLSLALAHRLPDSVSATRSKVSPEDRAVIIAEFRGMDLAATLSEVHPDLFFIFKTMNLVRSVNRDLDGSRVRRLALMFDEAVAGSIVPVPPLASDTHELLARLPVFAPYAHAAQRATAARSASTATVAADVHTQELNTPDGMVLIDVRTAPPAPWGPWLAVVIQRVALRALFTLYERFVARVVEGPDAAD